MPPYISNHATVQHEDFDEMKQEENSVCHTSKTESLQDFVSKLKWFNIILLSTIHVAFVWMLFAFPWGKSGYLILFHYILGLCSGIGVTAGAHRLWCHRSYKAKLPLRIILMFFYCLTGHNPLFFWVRDHRVHHKFTDSDADPHNSNRGFFFSHAGWLMLKKHPEVIRRGKEVDMSDLLEDPVIRFHQKYFVPLILSIGFILPSVIPPFWWGQCWKWSILATVVGRYCILLNVTWLVNSAAHMWGTNPYDRKISATDNISVSMLTLGEGWHNYHHAFPWDYKAAELGSSTTNSATFFIEFFAKIGWAYDLKSASNELIRKTIEKSNVDSQPTWEHVEIPEPTDKRFINIKNNNNEDKKIG